MSNGAGREMRILSPTAILGYGFPSHSLARGMARGPHLIAVDAGSTDPGPYYLGAGKSFTSRAGVKRDLSRLLGAALSHRVPLVVGSSGGSGAATHLAWTVDIVREIAREQSLRFLMAVIPADIPKGTVEEFLQAGRVRPVTGGPELSRAALDATPNIVAQMGWEPIAAALQQECPVVLCGRAYDPAVFAAAAIRTGYDAGLALHLGKILECAAIAATPGSGSDCVLAALRDDHFDLETLSGERAFTRASVAAHALYEQADPYRLAGPGGSVDLAGATYEELGDGRVRVRGARFVPAPTYAVKIEGARRVGFRTISVAGMRDPTFIRQADGILGEVRERVRASLPSATRIEFHVYGRDGVMGPGEPLRGTHAHELGLVIEAVAEDQATADAACALVRSTLLHHGYPGRVTTAGNLAFPFSPSDLSAGAVYEFSVYHLMEIDDPAAPFPVRVMEVSP